MKIYTRTGDDGSTALLGGTRVAKGDPRVCAYGDVDELNSLLGVIRSLEVAGQLSTDLADVQRALFTVGAELSADERKGVDALVRRVADSDITHLETLIDRAEGETQPLRSFILPGGSPVAAQLHLARTVCRRAERSVVRLPGEFAARPEVVRYLNRLSDLLFMWARLANHQAGVSETVWHDEPRDQ